MVRRIEAVTTRNHSLASMEINDIGREQMWLSARLKRIEEKIIDP
jgi:hypothetical protein